MLCAYCYCCVQWCCVLIVVHLGQWPFYRQGCSSVTCVYCSLQFSLWSSNHGTCCVRCHLCHGSRCVMCHNRSFVTVWHVLQYAMCCNLSCFTVCQLSQSVLSHSVLFFTVCHVYKCVNCHSVSFTTMLHLSQCVICHSGLCFTVCHVSQCVNYQCVIFHNVLCVTMCHLSVSKSAMIHNMLHGTMSYMPWAQLSWPPLYISTKAVILLSLLSDR